jgi:hypothetical protein
MKRAKVIAKEIIMKEFILFALMLLTLTNTCFSQYLKDPQEIIYTGIKQLDPDTVLSWQIQNKTNKMLACNNEMALLISRNASTNDTIVVDCSDENPGQVINVAFCDTGDNSYKLPERSQFNKNYTGTLKFHPGKQATLDFPFLYVDTDDNKITVCACKHTPFDNNACQSSLHLQSYINEKVIIYGDIIPMTDEENPNATYECLNISAIKQQNEERQHDETTD